MKGSRVYSYTVIIPQADNLPRPLRPSDRDTITRGYSGLSLSGMAGKSRTGQRPCGLLNDLQIALESSKEGPTGPGWTRAFRLLRILQPGSALL